MTQDYKCPIILLTDGTREHTLIADADTRGWHDGYPPAKVIKYAVGAGGRRDSRLSIAVLTVESIAVPARISGVVTDVRWVRWDGTDAPDYEPAPGRNPVGRRMAVKCDGVFANLLPDDEATEKMYKDGPDFNGFEWQFENGEARITLTCLVDPRPT